MEHPKLTKGDAIKYLTAVLFSALLTYGLLATAPKQATPSHFNSQAQVEVTSTSKAQVEKPVSPAKAPVGVTAPVQATVTPAPVPEPTPPTTHEQLMAAAGIQSKDYAAADYIISHESSWDVNATEPTTLAHGLVQALPYSKTGCGWTDGVCQLKWASTYAVERYGSWQGAYAHWTVNRWW